jgi:hypothetical protein
MKKHLTRDVGTPESAHVGLVKTPHSHTDLFLTLKVIILYKRFKFVWAFLEIV